MNPKKGPWLASSSFFCLKYSWSSLAFCLWNSNVITFLSSTAIAPATETGFGCATEDEEEGGEDWEGGWEGGVGLRVEGGEGSLIEGATGLLIGPSVWELLITVLAKGLVEVNLKDEVEEWGEGYEEEEEDEDE